MGRGRILTGVQTVVDHAEKSVSRTAVSPVLSPSLCLDQKDWIALAKAGTGKRDGAPIRPVLVDLRIDGTIGNGLDDALRATGTEGVLVPTVSAVARGRKRAQNRSAVSRGRGGRR